MFNALGGRLSDRTTWRWGRQRPWILIGAAGLLASMAVLWLGGSTTVLAIGWFLAQAFGNLAFSALFASISEQVPTLQYGRVSGIVGVAQNVSVLVATWMAAWFTDSMMLLFMAPAVLGAVCMVLYALSLPEPVLTRNRYPFNLVELISTFWRNPIRYPDFGLAWWGRFCIIFASFLFTAFRLLFMTNHLGLEEHQATTAVAVGVSIYTITSMAAGVVAGWISDITGRRKAIVAVAIAVFALGTYLLVHADSVGFFYLCEAIMGIAYGTYIAVDLALVLQVLPDPLTTGKDLGVINIANALPQSIAPAVGGLLLARLGHGSDSAARRGEIVEVAIELIGRHGYVALSMTQVAHAAGISPTGLAHHFRTKEDLLAAVLAHRDALETPVQTDPDGSPFAALWGLAEVARRNAERPELVRLFAAVSGAAGNPGHPAHPWIREHYEAGIDTLGAALREEQARGRIRPEAPVERIVREAIALMDGYQLQWLLDPTVDMAALLEGHVAEIAERWSVRADPSREDPPTLGR